MELTVTSSLGSIRAPRRPAGWRVPGSLPAAPRDRPDVWPQVGEDLCHLSGDWRILQLQRGHRWSLDDLVTAWFAARQMVSPQRIIDLGCGIGAVLLMLAWRFPAARCVGVEAEPGSAALARRSIAWNGVQNRCAVRGGDLRDPAVLCDGAVFDLVTATPPYVPRGSGREPSRLLQAPCHIEQRGGIEAYCRAAAALMGRGARLVVCHAAAQISRVQQAAHDADLAIASRIDVIPRSGKAPLFSVYAMQRESAKLAVLPPLVVRDRSGQWSDEFTAVRMDMGMPPRPDR
jgi:tRNA1(Val) A37 N6-methylase TrmN6